MKTEERQIFCGHSILIGVLVTQMSTNAETCRFTSDMLNTQGWFAEKGI